MSQDPKDGFMMKSKADKIKDKLIKWATLSKDKATHTLGSSTGLGLENSMSYVGSNATVVRAHTYEPGYGLQSRLMHHVPDFVWQTTDPVVQTPKAIMTNGVLLFADVSGFTALTERYSNHREGVSGLTFALNEYISAICQRILENGGDILKFAGDAILALWKCERNKLADCIALATHCALEIQSNHDWKMTSVGVELRVKIAISAGKIYCTHVGLPGQMRHIAMSGNPVGEVNAAEKHCESGDVVLSPNAWDLCQREIFKGFEVGDGRHKFFKVRFMTRKHFSADEFDNWRAPNPYPKVKSLRGLFIRDASQLTKNKSLEDYIRQYISQTVKEKLDDDQPREYLSEIRQCTILFINLVFDLKEQRRDYTTKLGNTLQASFEVVDEELRRKGGQLNKLFMFDKGCTFLAAFGLPGQKNEREAALALECAFQISKRMTSEIMELNRCSIGVTTGSVYVGVIGHDERHEYSFLGPKVNMAARIMMAGYPGMVNCDALTMKCSDLSTDYFIAQGYKPLKGIKDPGIIYQYTETMPPLTSYLRRNVTPEYPMLGRIDEIDRIMAETCSEDDRCFVVIEGEKGIGKTRLLEEIVVISQNIDPNLHVVNISTSYDIMKDDFKIVRIIIEDLLGIVDRTDRSPGSDAEFSIKEALQNSKYSKEEMELMNPIFGTFMNDKLVYQDDLTDSQIEKQSEMVDYMINKALDNFDRTLICIDCAQFIDSRSWRSLDHFANDKRASIVLAYRPQTRKEVLNDPNRITAFDHQENLHLKLRSLPDEYFPALACQMLRVTQVSEILAAAIIYKSFGNPGWTLLILKSLLDHDVIKIQEKGTSEKANEDVQFHEPPLELIVSRNLKNEDNAKNAKARLKSALPRTGRGSFKNSPSVTSIVSRSAPTKPDRSSIQDPEDEQGYEHPAVKPKTDDESIGRPTIHHAAFEDPALNRHGRQYIDILKKIGGYYENILGQGDHNGEEQECVLAERTTTLSSLITKHINAPQIIKSFILEQLDRLPPTTQQIAKECALVGAYFSRQIIYHFNQGLENSQKRVNRAFEQLIDAKIIEPIRTITTHKVTPSEKPSRARKSSLMKQIKIRQSGDRNHLRFTNGFFHEVIDNLWLDEQRRQLHQRCAQYFKNCAEELNRKQTVSEETIVEFAVYRELLRETVQRQKSVCNILNINIQEFEPRRVSYDPSKLKNQLLLNNNGIITTRAVIDDWTDHDEKRASVRNPMDMAQLKETVKASSTSLKTLGRSLQKSIAAREHYKNDEYLKQMETFVTRKMNSDSSVTGVLPAERDLFLSIINQLLAKHYEFGRQTETTIEYLLESANSLLRTGKLQEALSFLDKADDIMLNLSGFNGRKYDIIKDIYEGDTNFHNLDENMTVHSVPKGVKAYYETLIGDAHMLMGEQSRKHARKHYDTALRLVGESLSSISCTRPLGDSERDVRQRTDIWMRIGKHELAQGDKISASVLERTMQRILQFMPMDGSFTAPAIRSRGFCTEMISAQTSKRDQISNFELEVASVFCVKKKTRFDDIYAVHKFSASSYFARYAVGDLAGAASTAAFMVKISCWARSKSMEMISRIYFADVLLTQGRHEDFWKIIRHLETEVDPSPHPEIKCLLNILKLSAILATGSEIDNWSDITLWILPYGGCAFSNLEIANFSSCVALMNLRASALDAGSAWYNNAWKCLQECPVSFVYVRTYARLVECELMIYRCQCYLQSMPYNTLKDKGKQKTKIKEHFRGLESYCSRFPIFEAELLLLKAYYDILETQGSNAEGYLKSGITIAEAFGDQLTKAKLESSLSYVQDCVQDSWISKILFSPGKRKSALYQESDDCYIFTSPICQYPFQTSTQSLDML